MFEAFWEEKYFGQTSVFDFAEASNMAQNVISPSEAKWHLSSGNSAQKSWNNR